jgi:hypothetical protein
VIGAWVGKKGGACRDGKPLGCSPQRKSLAGLGEAFFFFYPISSEYQIERINRPNMIEGIRV